MANTTLTQTGAQVQADLDKVEGLANIKSIGSGLSLSNAGELSASSNNASSSIEGHTVTFTTDYDYTYVNICYLDANLKLHQEKVSKADMASKTFNNVYKIVGLYVSYNSKTSQSPNYVKASVSEAVIVAWSAILGIGYMDTRNYYTGFSNDKTDNNDQLEYYIVKDVAITFQYAGGGSGN